MGIYLNTAEYNLWANTKMSKWLSDITQDQWQQEVISSFSTIEQTVLHTVGAELIWLERLLQVEGPVWLPDVWSGNKEELINQWIDTSKRLEDFLEDFDDGLLDMTLNFQRMNGPVESYTYREIISHVLNHSTYHRGQIVTLLRVVGYTDLSSTDLIMYYREKNV